MSTHIVRVQIMKAKTVNFLQAVAFLSGETQYDTFQTDKNLQVINSTTSNQVVWNNIILPDKYEQQDAYRELPDYLKYRSNKKIMISNARNVLWKNVLSQETRPDGQLARLFNLSMPHFLTLDEATDLISSFAKELVNEGMIVDASIHDHNKVKQNLTMLEKLNILQGKQTEKEIVKEKEQIQDYTGYLMCSLRDYKNGYFHNKNRSWNSPNKLPEWRKSWIFKLYEAILTSQNGSREDIQNWTKKLKIYSEYEDIKNHFSQLMESKNILNNDEEDVLLEETIPVRQGKSFTL